MRINKRLIMLMATLLVSIVTGTVGARAAETAKVIEVPQGYGYGNGRVLFIMAGWIIFKE